MKNLSSKRNEIIAREVSSSAFLHSTLFLRNAASWLRDWPCRYYYALHQNLNIEHVTDTIWHLYLGFINTWNALHPILEMRDTFFRNVWHQSVEALVFIRELWFVNQLLPKHKRCQPTTLRYKRWKYSKRCTKVVIPRPHAMKLKQVTAGIMDSGMIHDDLLFCVVFFVVNCRCESPCTHCLLAV